MKTGRWKLDFEIGIGAALVILVLSAGLAAAATVKAKPRPVKKVMQKAAPQKVVAPVKKPTTTVVPRVAPKTVPKAPTTVKKESPSSSGIPVLTAPAPTPTSGFSSDY